MSGYRIARVVQFSARRIWTTLVPTVSESHGVRSEGASTHSLRAGLATSAIKAGVATFQGAGADRRRLRDDAESLCAG